MAPLTERFVRSDEMALYSTHAQRFLEAAATSTKHQTYLQQWLAQDRFYVTAYVNFIGSLLARVSVPTNTDCVTTMEWRIVGLLKDCLNNIYREIGLFEQTAAEEGWSKAMHDARPSVQTRAYQDIFAGAVAPSQPLIVGLTVLWATEECYLRAWTHARRMGRSCGGDLNVVQTVFIPNWSSTEFTSFVARIGELLNDYEDSLEECNRHWAECEAAFKQVAWAEAQFWPKVE